MSWQILTHNYLTRGFWGDEAWTAGISRLPIKEIINITGQDFHPPFYYFLVHYFGAGSNFAEVNVRLISTFFFVLTAITSFFLVKLFWQKTLGSKKTAQTPPFGNGVGRYLFVYITATLVLFSPILFTYAFEARSYGLLAFESIASAYIFWRAKDELKGHYLWRILYFVLGGIMVYTHYYAWFILASHAFYLLLFERKRLLPMILSAVGILLVQLPWLPTLLHQTGSVKDSYWIGAINNTTHLEFLWRVGGGDIQTIWQKPLAYALSALILIGLVGNLSKKSLKSHHLFLLTWLLVPTILPTLVSLTLFPVFFYRYLIFSAIPLIILAVEGLKVLPRNITYAIFAVILFGQLSVDYKIFAQYPRSMREATAELYQTKVPGDSPVYTVLPAFAEVMYYTAPHDQIIVEPEGLVQFSGKSLLDAYVRLGYTTIAEPPEGYPYYFLTPDKTVEHYNGSTE